MKKTINEKPALHIRPHERYITLPAKGNIPWTFMKVTLVNRKPIAEIMAALTTGPQGIIL
jgi:hypothetical protein